MELATKLDMKVKFEDTKENWLRWGELVAAWVKDKNTRPKTVEGLIEQADEKLKTKVSVAGNQKRKVEFYDYDEDELPFLLPPADMLQPAQPGKYPLPDFYDDAYDCKRRDLTQQEAEKFRRCRLGEYTINNCG